MGTGAVSSHSGSGSCARNRSARGHEEDPLGASAPAGFRQRAGTVHVNLLETGGGVRIAGNPSGKMEDPLHSVKGSIQPRSGNHVADDDLHASGRELGLGLAGKNPDRLASLKQQRQQMTAEKAGRPRDQHRSGGRGFGHRLSGSGISQPTGVGSAVRSLAGDAAAGGVSVAPRADSSTMRAASSSIRIGS